MARRRRFGLAESQPPAEPPPDVDAAATPDVIDVPSLQSLPKIVCGKCGGKALDARYRWREWRYYRCAASPQCVDPETGKFWITKVRAV